MLAIHDCATNVPREIVGFNRFSIAGFDFH